MPDSYSESRPAFFWESMVMVMVSGHWWMIGRVLWSYLDPPLSLS